MFPFSIREKAPQRIALATSVAAEGVLVRLRTAEGVTGFGECMPYSPVMGETQESAVAMGRAMAGKIRGRDPFDLAKIVADMDTFAPHNPGIKAAFEMALWDINGKVAGQPVYRLLGGYRDSFETDLTVFLETPETMARMASDVVRQGFKAVKVKVGEGPELDLARIRAIREAIGYDPRVRIDANQGWSPSAAVLALRGMEQYQIEFCEQPGAYWDWPGMRYVRHSVNIPIMADESVSSPHDAIAGLRQDAMDMINIKLMKSGGILRGGQIAHIAEAANLPCMVGCMSETRIALTAGAHLAASQKSIVYADLDAFLTHTVDPIIGGMQVKDGLVTLPGGPGLGAEPDPAFLSKLVALT
jgi:L-alanine-DL-glutamate epimerase-like enolase superfamily enzyme